MVYITVRQSPAYRQMTMEEFLSGGDVMSALLRTNTSNTRTYAVDRVSEKFMRSVDTNRLIHVLENFNRHTKRLRGQERTKLYHTFWIPKKSRGFRRIDEPSPELMNALRTLKTIFENDFGALYHTSAFAYIKKRSILDALRRHQSNESKWFAKFDLHNFFGSTTIGFVMKQLSMVFPFSEVVKTKRGYDALYNAVELGFLSIDGAEPGLPQGTPLSPMLTNLIMIPIDYELCNKLREYDGNQFVCTRYADDMQISSRYNFNFRDIERTIEEVYQKFDAPYKLNREKTRYGSSAGRNWNLGLMLNKDNEITVGYRAKRQFQCAISSYAKDKKNGISWELHDLRVLEGKRNYYRMIEGATIDRIIDSTNEKFGINIVRELRRDLRAG